MLNLNVWYQKKMGVPISKGDWTTYRTGIAAADTAPVGLLTPATVVTTYMTTAASRPAAPINTNNITRLIIRGKTTVSSNLVIQAITWGNEGKAGQPVTVLSGTKTHTLTATACRDGDGADGAFLTDALVFDIGAATSAHVFVTNIGTAVGVALELMGD